MHRFKSHSIVSTSCDSPKSLLRKSDRSHLFACRSKCRRMPCRGFSRRLLVEGRKDSLAIRLAPPTHHLNNTVSPPSRCASGSDGDDTVHGPRSTVHRVHSPQSLQSTFHVVHSPSTVQCPQAAVRSPHFHSPQTKVHSSQSTVGARSAGCALQPCCSSYQARTSLLQGTLRHGL